MAGSNWTQEDVDAYNLRRKIMGKVAEAVPETHAAPVAKPRKYRNEPTEVDGIVFASKREASRYRELLLLKKMGKIFDLEIQKAFELVPSVKLDGRKKPSIRYVVDFWYFDGLTWIAEDTKSPNLRKNPVYRMKKHMMVAFRGIEVREI